MINNSRSNQREAFIGSQKAILLLILETITGLSIETLPRGVFLCFAAFPLADSLRTHIETRKTHLDTTRVNNFKHSGKTFVTVGDIDNLCVHPSKTLKALLFEDKKFGRRNALFL